jgi:transposase
MLMTTKEQVTVARTEVEAKPRRRSFTAEYKRRILAEVDACDRGEQGALLRREGLYSSHLVAWRRARKGGELEGLAAKKRGPAPKRDERDETIARQEKEIAKLRRRAEHAEAIVEVQKKVAALLGSPLPEMEGES